MLKHNGKYDVLGVAATADAKAIRAAFLQLAKVHHPDKGGDPVKFNRINEAYLTLNDPVLREKHDSSLFGLAVFEHRAPAPAPAPPTPQEVAEIPEMAGCPSSRLANAGQRFEELLAHMRRMHLLSVGDRLGVWFAEFRKAIESMLGTSARWRTEYATRLLELLQSWHDLYLRSEYREAAMQECARLLRDLMARTRFPAAQDERERELPETVIARFIVRAMAVILTGACGCMSPEVASRVRSVARQVPSQGKEDGPRDAWIERVLRGTRAQQTMPVRATTIPSTPPISLNNGACCAPC